MVVVQLLYYVVNNIMYYIVNIIVAGQKWYYSILCIKTSCINLKFPMLSCYYNINQLLNIAQIYEILRQLMSVNNLNGFIVSSLSFMKHALKMNFTLYDYSPVLRLLNSSTSADRRQSHNFSSLHKLWSCRLLLSFLHKLTLGFL